MPTDPRDLRGDAPLLDAWLRFHDQPHTPFTIPGHKQRHDLVGDVVAGDLPPGERYALLASWDQVLALDLERAARESWEPSEEVLALVAERDDARAAKDYARSDELRQRLQAMGLEVMDTPDGTTVRPTA